MQLYCTVEDLRVHLKEDLPSQLSSDADPDGLTDRQKITNHLIAPASAWIDGVFHVTGPFPRVEADHAMYMGRSNDLNLYELAGAQAFVFDTTVGDCIKDFGEYNRIFTSDANLPQDESNEDGRYIALISTPPLVRQACVEYAMSLAWTILNRNTESELVMSWRKQAMQTLSVNRDGYAQKRPHPLIPHNTGIASINYS